MPSLKEHEWNIKIHSELELLRDLRRQALMEYFFGMRAFMKLAARQRLTCIARLMAACVLTAVLIVLVGCASTRPLVLDPIGPAPNLNATNSPQGSLVVYSAFEPTADLNRSPYRARYTDYQILSADGNHVLQTVRNNRETLLNTPAAVELIPGPYRVIARANGYGEVTVPVVVRAGQVTTVHLEGSVWWPRSSPIFASNPVRLPKGEIAGWRAEPNTQ